MRCFTKALNVVIRMDPNLKYPFNTRSFFTPAGKKDIGAGLELWQGYFQSLRPSQNKMYINIDISTGVMYKAMPLIALCLEFLRKKNPAELGKISDRERLQLQRFISGLRFETTYGARKRVHVVKKISRDSAQSYMFNREDGSSTSVAQYFRTLNINLQHPLLPCIEASLIGVFILPLLKFPIGRPRCNSYGTMSCSSRTAYAKAIP